MMKYYYDDKRKLGHVAHMREKEIAYRILFGKPKGKRLGGRSKHRSNDNVKIGFKERE